MIYEQIYHSHMQMFLIVPETEQYLLCVQLVNVAHSFPDVLTHRNVSATYQALAHDKLSPQMMSEIRAFLQDLLEYQVHDEANA